MLSLWVSHSREATEAGVAVGGSAALRNRTSRSGLRHIESLFSDGKKKKKLEISAVGCLGVRGYLTSHHSSAAERRRWWQIGTECDMLLGEDYVAPAGGRAHSDG